MISPIDPSTLSPQAQKIVSASAPEKLQEVAARGVVPGVHPVEIVAVLVLLAQSGRATVAATAQRTIAALPDAILSSALGAADRLNAATIGPTEALLAFGPDSFIRGGAARLNLSPQGDLHEAAANLYAMLHSLDKPAYTVIAVMPIPDVGIGIAINDRLRRAAAPRGVFQL